MLLQLCADILTPPVALARTLFGNPRRRLNGQRSFRGKRSCFSCSTTPLRIALRLLVARKKQPRFRPCCFRHHLFLAESCSKAGRGALWAAEHFAVSGRQQDDTQQQILSGVSDTLHELCSHEAVAQSLVASNFLLALKFLCERKRVVPDHSEVMRDSQSRFPPLLLFICRV